jgi:diacylglycerol kinase (ATP)
MRSKADLQAAIRLHRRAVLVVNTRSRRGARMYRDAGRRLEAAGFGLLGSFAASRPGQLETSLAAALDLAPDLLIAGGGDGTVSLAARHLAHRDIALGIVPSGTTNNFARTLGIPLTTAGAVGVLTGGKVADVDLGHVNGTYFANLVSVGLSGHVAATVRPGLKRLLGRPAYPLTALARLPRHRPFQAAVTAGGQTRTFTTHQLNVANGSFHAVRHALAGARRSQAEPAFLATTEVWLHTDPPLPLDIDGEISGQTPARITLAPNALRVMVSPGFPDT